MLSLRVNVASKDTAHRLCVKSAPSPDLGDDGISIRPADASEIDGDSGEEGTDTMAKISRCHVGVQVRPGACSSREVAVASQGVGLEMEGLSSPRERDSRSVNLGVGDCLFVEVPSARTR